MLWFRLGVIYSGSMSFLDIALFSYYAFIYKGSTLELGILSAAWSVVYILTNLLLGGIADKGHNKALALISIISFFMLSIFFKLHTKMGLAIAYILHAIASTSISLSLSVSVLELVDSSLWYKANSFLRLGNYISRGVFLVVFSRTIGNDGLELYIYISLAIGLSTLILIPSIGLAIERKLYMITKAIDELVGRASSWSLYSGSINPSAIHFLSSERLQSKNGLSAGKILFAILLVVALGDYVFVVFTYLLAGKLIYSSYLLFMGLVAILVGPILLVLSRSMVSSKGSVASMIIIRGLVFLLFLQEVDTPLEGILFMLVSNILYAWIEASLYNMYVQATTGFKTNMFFIARELGSVFGSLLGGYLWRNASSLYMLVAVVILVLTILQFIGKTRETNW